MMHERWMSTLLRAAAAGGAALAVALVPAATTPALASGPVATAAGGCSISRVWHALGPTYVEQLSVTHTTCATGESVVKAYNACRLRHGGRKGYCHSTVDGYRCTEQRPMTSAIQFIAKARCTAGNRVVVFTYSENT